MPQALPKAKRPEFETPPRELSMESNNLTRIKTQSSHKGTRARQAVINETYVSQGLNEPSKKGSAFDVSDDMPAGQPGSTIKETENES